MSSQPSPSASKKAHPEPSVSGRNFFPARPLLCVHLIPAAAVTSVNFTGVGAATSQAPSSARPPAIRLTAGLRNNGGAPGGKRQRNRLVIVDRLALVVVLRAHAASLERDRLRRLFSLEPAEELLLAGRTRLVSQAAATEHRGGVHLACLGGDRGAEPEQQEGL